jgi:two-component system sensor histidine kinase YesM
MVSARYLRLLPKYLISHGILVLVTAAVVAALGFVIARHGLETYSGETTQIILDQGLTLLSNKEAVFQRNLVSELDSALLYQRLRTLVFPVTNGERIELQRSLSEAVSLNFWVRSMVVVANDGVSTFEAERLGRSPVPPLPAVLTAAAQLWGRSYWYRSNSGAVCFAKILFDPLTSEKVGSLVCEVAPDFFEDVVPSNQDPSRGNYQVVATASGDTLFATGGLGAPDAAAGASYLVSEVQRVGTGWRLRSLVSLKALNQLSVPTAYQVLQTTLIVLVLSLVSAFLIVRSEVSRISRLVAQTRAIGQGDFSGAVFLNTHDELGELSSSIANMAVELKQLLDRLMQESLRKTHAELRAVEFEYASLQARMNPHLVSNVLEYINSLSKIHRLPKIGQAACELGDLLRAAIRRTGHFIALQEEIDHCLSYVRVHELLRDSGLVTEVEVPPELTDWPVPNLILQPLVENAVIHGLDPLVGRAWLAIRASADGDAVRITVEDNGVGMDLAETDPWTPPETEAGRHIGLWSVRHRLRLLYGDDAELTLASGVGKGTTVAFRVPRPREEA